MVNPLAFTFWFLPLLWEAQAEDNNYISLHKLLIVFPSKMLAFFSFSLPWTLCSKNIFGSRGGKQPTEMLGFFFLIRVLKQNWTTFQTLIRRMICTLSTSQTPSNVVFSPEGVGRKCIGFKGKMPPLIPTKQRAETCKPLSTYCKDKTLMNAKSIPSRAFNKEKKATEKWFAVSQWAHQFT